MMKKCVSLILCLVLISLLGTVAFAAQFKGNIWTNSPKRTLGIVYGYYCTAAVNESPNGTNQYAHSLSKLNGATVAESYAIDNEWAVANSGLTKPDSGYGEYGEDGGHADMYFGSGAYIDY